MRKGNLIISLDFELHWGAVEKWDLNIKGKCFDNTRQTIPAILAAFQKYDIHATWATVGFLFAKSREQLLAFCPSIRPTYEKSELNYYNLIDENIIGENERDDPYHFAMSLIEQIIATPHQELASHTFTHYYCNEKGQNIEQFTADLRAAQNLAKENFGMTLESLVLPRNQFNEDYIEAAGKEGFKVIRSNPDVWFWNFNLYNLSPVFRGIDTLFPISSSVTFDQLHIKNDVLLLPASRFLRPFSPKEQGIQVLKFRRIKAEMHYAAKHGKDYHLWWHPCNFGDHPSENLIYLDKILSYYYELKLKYGFSSKSMIEMRNDDLKQ